MKKELIEKWEATKEIEYTEGKPTAIVCNVAAKVSTGPYENMTIDAGLQMSLKEDADVETAYEQGWMTVLDQVVRKIGEIKEAYDQD